MNIRPINNLPLPHVEPNSETSEEKRRQQDLGNPSGRRRQKDPNMRNFRVESAEVPPCLGDSQRTIDLNCQIVDSGKVVELLNQKPKDQRIRSDRFIRQGIDAKTRIPKINKSL